MFLECNCPLDGAYRDIPNAGRMFNGTFGNRGVCKLFCRHRSFVLDRLAEGTMRIDQDASSLTLWPPKVGELVGEFDITKAFSNNTRERILVAEEIEALRLDLWVFVRDLKEHGPTIGFEPFSRKGTFPDNRLGDLDCPTNPLRAQASLNKLGRDARFQHVAETKVNLIVAQIHLGMPKRLVVAFTDLISM